MKKAFLALILIGCSQVPGDPVAKPVPQIDSMNCVTEIATETSECDAGHALVMHCGSANAQPSDVCYTSSAAADGLIWCCERSFADTCGDLCD